MERGSDAFGYPDLRLVDFTDGLVLSAPIARGRPVTLIPLEQFAPELQHDRPTH